MVHIQRKKKPKSVGFLIVGLGDGLRNNTYLGKIFRHAQSFHLALREKNKESSVGGVICNIEGSE